MANGTLNNLAQSAFVRTPPQVAEIIRRNILAFPDKAVSILDPAAGEGDLLTPFQGLGAIYGIELSADRAAAAKTNVPSAQIIISPMEHVRITPKSLSLVVVNPPYFTQDGVRAEYTFIRDATQALMPGGILVAIVPARSAINVMVARFIARAYEPVRVFKFPDLPDTEEAAFAHFTQVVIVGKRRPAFLEAADEETMNYLLNYRYDKLGKGTPTWEGGSPPPDLPDTPLDVPYQVPPALAGPPEFTIVKASESVLLRALELSGVQGKDWQAATTAPAQETVAPSVMPATGVAHMAAEVLSGLFDGEVVLNRYLLTSFVTQKWVSVSTKEEQEKEDEKGNRTRILDVQHLQDYSVLGVLDLHEDTVAYYEGEEAFGFLQPILNDLAQGIIEKRKPMYRLDPRNWEIGVVATIGLDKQLPGAAHPGLAVPQHHRVYAMWRALETRKQVAIQGEPGTGKTRMLTALMALFGHAAQHREEVGRQEWLRRLNKAWKANPRTKGERPRALPILVVTPKRVMPTWKNEIEAAYPGAETVSIESFQDIPAWMDRCAESDAPVVVGIVSQSKTRAFSHEWHPAVVETGKMQEVAVTNLERAASAVEWNGRWVFPADLTRRGVNLLDPEWQETLEAIGLSIADDGSIRGTDGAIKSQEEVLELAAQRRTTISVHRTDGRVVLITDERTGLPITELKRVPSYFCPDCGTQVKDVPLGGKKPKPKPKSASESASESASDGDQKKDEDEEDARKGLEPVTHIHYFTQQPRVCRRCGSPLWTQDLRSRDRYPQVGFGAWARTARTQEWTVVGRDADGAGGYLVAGHQEPAPSDFSPYDYLYRFYRGCVALTIVDESHNARGRRTDIARSVHWAGQSAQRYVYASGTHYGGTLSDLYWYWYRFDPAFWKALNLGWEDLAEATKRYGVTAKIIKEHQSDARKGSGKEDISITTRPAPGISAKLLPHLLAGIAFIGILDVGNHMPDKVEIPKIVSLADPLYQETIARTRVRAEQALSELEWAKDQGDTDRITLAAEAYQQAREAVDLVVASPSIGDGYHLVEGTLVEMAKAGNAAASLASGTLPRLWATLPMVEPPFSVVQQKKGTWGEYEGEKVLFVAPVLPQEHRYPLERECLSLIQAERDEGRSVMVYIEQNGKRSTADRLLLVLQDFDPWVLPNGVDAEDREDAIKQAHARGHRVLIVPYRRVAEGLNLQMIDSLIWYEMAMNLFFLDQSSRRIWRLGATGEKRLYYLAYQGTVVHKKLNRLGTQSGAASLFAGETPDGALVKAAGADQTTLARLSADLEHSLDAQDQGDGLSEAELTAAFARRAMELKAALKAGRQFAGITDWLPSRLEAWRNGSLASFAVPTDAATPSSVVVPTDAATPGEVEVETLMVKAVGEPLTMTVGPSARRKKQVKVSEGQVSIFDLFS